MWNKFFDREDYAYGTEPNAFLKSVYDYLPAGKVLSLAEGEGRNAVWLAEQGRQVTGIDSSHVGLAKARKLAAERGVEIETINADLAEFKIASESVDVIVLIFCHLPPKLRKAVHSACVAALRPGGAIVLEAYTPAQLENKTGGPKSVEMMMTANALRSEFAGLTFEILQETTREVHEGQFHTGTGAVVQMLARKE